MWATTAIFGLLLAGDPSVDLTQTWVQAGNERLAMGGAGLGFATGAPGLEFTPAALGWRRAEQTGPVVFTGTGNLGGLGGTTGDDLGDQGHGAWRGGLPGLKDTALLNSFGAATAGAGLLVHRVGVGFLATGSALRDLDTPGEVANGDLRGAVALSFGGTASLGMGVHVHSVRISDGVAESRGLGVGIEAGGLARIPQTGLNVGLTLRTAVRDGNPGGELRVEDMVVPAGGSVGVSWASNATPTPPGRRPLRLAAGFTADAPVPNAVSAESLAQGAPTTRGAQWSFEPRIGAEWEVWPTHLRVLGGSYLEPSRIEGTRDRLHGTAGLELGVLPLRIRGLKLPISARCAFDLAPRFQGLHWFGLGIWHTGVVGGTEETRPVDPPVGF